MATSINMYCCKTRVKETMQFKMTYCCREYKNLLIYFKKIICQGTSLSINHLQMSVFLVPRFSSTFCISSTEGLKPSSASFFLLPDFCISVENTKQNCLILLSQFSFAKTYTTIKPKEHNLCWIYHCHKLIATVKLKSRSNVCREQMDP